MDRVTAHAREASVGLERARAAIWSALREDDDDASDSLSEDIGEESASPERSRGSPSVSGRGGFAVGAVTPVGASIDARARALEARGRALAARTSAGAGEGEAPAREALERAIAERDLEIFRRDEELRATRAALATVRAPAADGGQLRDASASAEALEARRELEAANSRAAEAEAMCRSMREMLNEAEERHARERTRLEMHLRESRGTAVAYANDMKARLEKKGTEESVSRRELEATLKRADVAEAFAKNLEAMLAEKCEEVFEVSQERDELRRKLKATSEVIESLEREWQEVAKRSETTHKALKQENEELHAIVEQLKADEKNGFAEAEMENEALRERLRSYEEKAVGSSRSVDRNLARESIASLRAKVRELKSDIERKDAEIIDLRAIIERKSLMEAVSAEKDSVITALQAQINELHETSKTPKLIASTTPNDVEINSLDELQTVVEALRRENETLRGELDAVDADAIFEDCLALTRRVTAQNSLLASYEERLVRYTEQLGIPFTPEKRP